MLLIVFDTSKSDGQKKKKNHKVKSRKNFFTSPVIDITQVLQNSLIDCANNDNDIQDGSFNNDIQIEICFIVHCICFIFILCFIFLIYLNFCLSVYPLYSH